MLTLLSPLFGIIGSLLPSIVKIFERNQEIKYEMEMNRLRMEAAIQNAHIQIAIEDAKADVADAQSVRSYDNNIDGGRFINALKSSIRPVITYCFFSLFVAVKIAAAYVMIQQGDSIPVMLDAVWDTDTKALFGTIIAFWFGARIMEKMGYGGIQQNKLSFITNNVKKK